MDVDKNEDSNILENSSNRLYKSAISGILSNKSKYESNSHDPLNLKSHQDRKLGLISRLIGKPNQQNYDTAKGSSFSRWKHDKYESIVSRKPGSMIFVRNLPNDVTQEYLKLYFNSSGTVCSIKVSKRLINNHQIIKGALTSASVGFVESDSAQKAVDSFHKQEMNGRTIKVSISDTGGLKYN